MSGQGREHRSEERARSGAARGSELTTQTGQVLVLGGTGEARRLAAALVADGVDVLSSLAGRVAEPVLPAGEEDS